MAKAVFTLQVMFFKISKIGILATLARKFVVKPFKEVVQSGHTGSGQFYLNVGLLSRALKRCQHRYLDAFQILDCL